MEIGFVTYDFEELRKEYTFDENILTLMKILLKNLLLNILI